MMISLPNPNSFELSMMQIVWLQKVIFEIE